MVQSILLMYRPVNKHLFSGIALKKGVHCGVQGRAALYHECYAVPSLLNPPTNTCRHPATNTQREGKLATAEIEEEYRIFFFRNINFPPLQ